MTTGFGQWLKEQRKRLHLTQEELAARVNCSPETVRKFEAGTRRPSIQIVELLANVFSVSLEEREAFISFARGLVALNAGEDAAQPPIADHVQTPWRETPRPLTNLPTPLTRLIGREKQVAQLRDLLACGTARLLTLTGPPGVGKTRLALQVAAEVVNSFEDGVYFVALAPISDPEVVMRTVAETLGVQEGRTGTLGAALEAYLRSKRLLLVLDNFEQVVEAGTMPGELLSACPLLRVLVTSREALRVHGERQFPVPPLEVPPWAHPSAPATGEARPGPGETDPSSLLRYPAVALFVENAQRVVSDFSPTEENGEAVAEICARLDGLPLAIELAAARTKLLTPGAILQKLGRGPQLLNSGTAVRNLPPRQRTLRSAIDWSYELLEEWEQTLFRRLGVFVGGFSLLSAEAVCNAQGDLPLDVLNGLESLLDKSLLVSQAGVGGEPRFAMLETVREYAKEQLVEAASSKGGEGRVIRRLHSEFFLGLAELAEVALNGKDEVEWIERMNYEYDNMRAVLRWSLEAQEDGDRDEDRIELGLRLAGALGYFWEIRGYFTEGHHWFTTLLEGSKGPTHRTAARAKALMSAARMLLYTEHYATGRRFAEESLAISRELGDERGIAHALLVLRFMALMPYSRTAPPLPETPEDNWFLYNALKDTHHLGEALVVVLGVLALQGKYGEVLALYKEHEEAVRERCNRRAAGALRGPVQYSAIRLGLYDEAVVWLREDISMFRETADWQFLMLKLRWFGEVAWRRDSNAERATRLFAAMEALYEALHLPLLLVTEDEYSKCVADARAKLGEAAWQTAWQGGKL